MSFTFAMITLPIGTYFFTAAYVFKGACVFVALHYITLSYPTLPYIPTPTTCLNPNFTHLTPSPSSDFQATQPTQAD